MEWIRFNLLRINTVAKFLVHENAATQEQLSYTRLVS